jgi:NAD(P)-dependent dehydrogenase (short-subunit alcohol dehydrogenase family)
LGFHSFGQPEGDVFLLPAGGVADAAQRRGADCEHQFVWEDMRPWSQHAHYCASKAGVIMLTRALAKAFAPDITVNAVAPGVIPFEERDERIERFIAATPAKRAGTADEIADAVLFFLTASNFVTGQNLAVDGGLSQR